MSVTVTTVPKGSVGLAHRPGGASAYHVACPCSVSTAAGGETATAWATTGLVVGVVVIDDDDDAVVAAVVVTGTDARSRTGADGVPVVVGVGVVGVVGLVGVVVVVGAAVVGVGVGVVGTPGARADM
jgi:hypothetical protein